MISLNEICVCGKPFDSERLETSQGRVCRSCWDREVEKSEADRNMFQKTLAYKWIKLKRKLKKLVNVSRL